MPLIALQPIRVGDRILQPGDELPAEDLKGRNVASMKRHGEVGWVDEAKSPSRGSRAKSPSRASE